MHRSHTFSTFDQCLRKKIATVIWPKNCIRESIAMGKLERQMNLEYEYRLTDKEFEDIKKAPGFEGVLSSLVESIEEVTPKMAVHEPTQSR